MLPRWCLTNVWDRHAENYPMTTSVVSLPIYVKISSLNEGQKQVWIKNEINLFSVPKQKKSIRSDDIPAKMTGCLLFVSRKKSEWNFRKQKICFVVKSQQQVSFINTWVIDKVNKADWLKRLFSKAVLVWKAENWDKGRLFTTNLKKTSNIYDYKKLIRSKSQFK